MAVIDASKIDILLAVRLTAIAKRADATGCAPEPMAERLVAALLNGRCDWLPTSLPNPLMALLELETIAPAWAHTALAISSMKRGSRGEFSSEVID